jgi:site-specific recombinase XerD
VRFATKGRPEDASSSRIFLGNRRSARTGNHEPLSSSGVDQLIRDLAVTAGITKRVYPHLFRHSFITNYLRSGGNPILCAQVVGHETLAMITSTYQHLVVSDAAVELMRLLEQ